MTINQLKEIVKLENKKYRIQNKKYLIFGEHLIREAFKYNKIELILTTESMQKKINQFLKVSEKNDITIEIIKKSWFERFKGVKTTPEIVGICSFDETKINLEKPIIGLNNISDPGNLGTIIRTAKAFGINDIILDINTVDMYNIKTIQATQGTHFSMNIKKTNLYKFAEKYRGTIFTTFLDKKNSVQWNKQTKKIEDNFLLIIGNESQGIEEKFKKLKYTNIKLDIEYESLNASIAAGIIIYNLRRNDENHRNN